MRILNPDGYIAVKEPLLSALGFTLIIAIILHLMNFETKYELEMTKFK